MTEIFWLAIILFLSESGGTSLSSVLPYSTLLIVFEIYPPYPSSLSTLNYESCIWIFYSNNAFWLFWLSSIYDIFLKCLCVYYIEALKSTLFVYKSL